MTAPLERQRTTDSSALAAERMTKTFGRDEIVFAEGSEGSHMYLIVAGSVNIIKLDEDERTVLTTLGPGEMFGEMALLDTGIRTATAVAAADDTRVMAIDQGRFVYLVSQQPAFALSVMRVLSRRIIALSAQLVGHSGETHGQQ